MKARTITTTVLVVALSLTGCGGDEGGADPVDETESTDSTGPVTELPAATLVLQEPISEGEWEQLKGQNEALGELVTKGLEDGYKNLAASGKVQDSEDRTVTWGVLAKDGEDAAERVVLVGCDAAGSCVGARADVKDGKASFTDAKGGSVDAPMTVAPAMVKNLEGADLDGKTTLPAALTADEVPVVDLSKRRFILANAFGDVFGVTMSDTVALAKSSGAFSEVADHQYAGRSVLVDAIRNSAPFDALVWVGASVRQEVGTAHKTIGMTVNRGIYGDETFTSQEIKKLLETTPFGGPGLVVLVGGQSWGDESGQEQKNLSLFRELADPENQHRVVVGFNGNGKAEDLLDAAHAFLQSFFGGATLEAAVAATNTLLSDRGSAVRMVSNRDDSIASEVTFLGDLGAFWGEAGAPKEVRSNHFVTTNLICFPKNGDAYQEGDKHANFFVDANFDGPVFTGERKNEDVGLDVKVEGIMSGTTPGSRVFLKISGDLKLTIKGISVWGIGTVQDKSDKDNPGRIFYDGDALATTYTNDVGDECELKAPKLSGATSQPSWMNLPQ